MQDQIELFDVVSLREDDREHNLQRGETRTVVEILAPGVFEVEFVDDEGRTYALVTLRRDQVAQLSTGYLA